jgi:hypothetical protein
LPDFEFNDIASIGLIRDIPAHQLPPEAFTTAMNGRFTRDGFRTMDGWTQVFGTLSGGPYFVQAIRTPSAETWWVYASLTAYYLFDGATHDDISRTVGGAYNSTGAKDFNCTFLGGVPIFNNGIDAPQFLANYTPGTNLADLTNWGAGDTAKVFRAFGPNLVALNVEDSGVAYPSLVWWSHPADPGTVPSSWDYTDETKDAGRTDLPDSEAGVLLNGLPLRGQMILYKENSTWLMRRIGGNQIFQFDQLFVTSGLLCSRAAALTGDGKFHFVVTQDDIIRHDGNDAVSIIDKKMRRTLFSQIDTQAFAQSFVFTNPLQTEMWFCYPSTGQTVPDQAIVWNYGTGPEAGVLYEAEVPFQCATLGDLEESGSTWDSDTDTWDSDGSPWNTSDRRKVVVGDPVTGKLYQLDDGITRDGATFTATLQREGLAILGRRRSGEPIVDFKKRKFIRRVWIKGSGGPFNVRVGFADLVDGAITWSGAQSFDPSSALFVDVAGSGQVIAVEFSGTTAFNVNGYTLELMGAGRF